MPPALFNSGGIFYVCGTLQIPVAINAFLCYNKSRLKLRSDYMIRRAQSRDLDGLNRLLLQVCSVHAGGRPDIFIDGGKKYTDEELLEIIADDMTPVFVCVDEEDYVQGYAFCVFKITPEGGAVHGRRTLYIDDLCVDETLRGKHIGSRIYARVLEEARKTGCDSITLNVWELNSGARKFYEKMGLLPLKTTMEALL